MFRGNHPARVDDKGRLKLPAEFKRRVDEVYGPQFYITSRNGERAELYPIREWEAVEAKLAANPSSVAKKFIDITNYYGQMVEMDAQGRLLLPQLIRDAARVTAEVDVLGTQRYLEVVNHDSFSARMKQEPLNESEMDSLAGIGI